MATIEQKQTALKTWLRTVSGLGINNVILRNAGGPVPTGPYIIFDKPVKVSGSAPFLADESVIDGVITRVFVSVIVAKSGIDFYGDAGVEFFDKLQLSASAFAPRSALAASDLTYIRHTSPIYIPAYDETEPENRYRSDVYFYTQINYTETDSELQNTIASVALVDQNGNEMTGDVSVEEETEE